MREEATMAADNLLNVNLPPVQWTTDAAPREPRQDSAEQEDKKVPKAKAKKQQAAGKAESEDPVEETATHEFDSFA
jgi:hypothetical protein